MISSILRRTCCFDLQITRSGDHFAFTSGPSSGVEGVVGIFEHRNANVFALLKTEDRVVHIELSQFFQTARIKEAHATESELAHALASVVDAVWPVIGGADPTEINDPKTFPPSKLATPQPAVTEPQKSLSKKQLQALEKKRMATEKKAAAAAAVIINKPRARKPTSAPPAPVSAPTVKAKAAGVGATTLEKQAKSKHETSTCFNISNGYTLTINRQ